MLMVHSSLLQAIKEHYEKIFMRALTQFWVVVGMYMPLALSVQVCLKKHLGNLVMLSQAGGLNLTRMCLQQEDVLYETLAEESADLS